MSISKDRCSNASDSPRDSLEIHSNRPIPAPRLHGSNNNVHTSEQGSQHKGSSQHQQGKQHGHTRQGSYGSTAAILSHINTSSPMLPSGPNKTKSSVGQSCGSNALYAIPCKNGPVGGSGLSSNHGQTAMKANHNIAPEVPLSPKPEIPSHACTPRRDSHGSTGSFSNSHGCQVSDGEKSCSIGKSISHLMKDGERREKKHKSHGEKKSREDRKGNGERKGRHGEKRGHGKRHRGDGNHGSPSSSKSKAERPSYGKLPSNTQLYPHWVGLMQQQQHFPESGILLRTIRAY